MWGGQSCPQPPFSRLHRGQNLKWTTQYLRLPRNGSPIRPSNQFTLQLQFMYF